MPFDCDDGSGSGEPVTEGTETILRVEHKSATLSDYVALLRPAQWIKNVVVFAGPAAGLRLFSLTSFGQALGAFFAFCLAASATYAINDVVDRRADAKHPTKCHRPVARGIISPAGGVFAGCVLIFLAVTLTMVVHGRPETIVVLLYFVMTLAYSLVLKRRMILDVITIAMGFVLRAWGGALAVGVDTSEWLVACIFTLCLFMGFGKRRLELVMIGNVEEAGRHRRTLIRYTPDLLNHLITVSAGIAVVTFLLYTMDSGGSPSPFHKEHLFYTLPIVVYGIFRFAMLTELGAYSGPTEIVLHDIGLQAAVISWVAIALVIVYQEPMFGPGGLQKLFGWL